MKIILTLFCFVILNDVESAAVFNSSLDTHWQNFKEKFQKHYTASEEGIRRLIWQDNVAGVVQHNFDYDMGLHSFTNRLNEYADLSHYEFVRTMNGFRRSRMSTNSSTFTPPSLQVLPKSIDWRKQGLVTRVKNQGTCGSCWAFSVTGSLEGQHKRKTGVVVTLSEQNLVDCSRSKGNYGCKGGFIDKGFEYIRENGGIDTEQSYPYTAEDGTCNYKPSASGVSCTGYVNIPSRNEDALQRAVAAVGPVSAAIDASHFNFQFYSGGIYDEPNCSTDKLNHGVLIIGYGTENGHDYWLVKNSWGTSWGENGYIKMSRNKSNQCGIATQASYPLV